MSMKHLLWLWQLPQILLAELYYQLTYEKIGCYQIIEDVVIYIGDYNGGMTLGDTVFLSESLQDTAYVIKHELGHTKQSKILGPLYLIIIGLPSLLWAALRRVTFLKKYNYYSFYTEKWANKFGGLE